MNGSKNVVGIDIAKRVFQLHWIDMETGEIVSLQLKREKFLEDFKSSRRMRRGSADSIRASRSIPAQQAGYRTAAYLSQHTKFALGKREASI